MSRAQRACRGASYADKILQGAKPADLPVEQPTTFDIIVKLKAARALGFTIRPPLLQQATEILQQAWPLSRDFLVPSPPVI